MSTITNEFMQQMLANQNNTRCYFNKRPNDNLPERKEVVWEHGRKIFELRAGGLLFMFARFLIMMFIEAYTFLILMRIR